MSDEQQQAQPDDSEPTPERQAELRAAYEKNMAEGKAPYAGVEIHTLAELRCVMQERGWSGEYTLDQSLERANLSNADLSGANLSDAFLVGANLSGADVRNANLGGADLTSARMNVETVLAEALFSTTTRVADVIWNDAPLARVAWDTLPRLGDEATARKRLATDDKQKNAARRRFDYVVAVRAYRLLAVALRSQGLNEHADRYAYRAQLMQRVVLRLQRHYLRWLGSLILWLIAGYGYRPLRSFATYLLVILGFAAAYYLLGNNASPALDVHGAIVFSLTSFHGRGFSPGGSLSPDNPLTTLAAIEAVFGLLIEITFIATFTNRFFGAK